MIKSLFLETVILVLIACVVGITYNFAFGARLPLFTQDKGLVKTRLHPIKQITASELDEKLTRLKDRRPPELIIFDLRKREDYVAARIPTATHYPTDNLDKIFRQFYSHITNAKYVVIYSDNDQSILALTKTVNQTVFNNLYTLKGGYESWDKFQKSKKEK